MPPPPPQTPYEYTPNAVSREYLGKAVGELRALFLHLLSKTKLVPLLHLPRSVGLAPTKAKHLIALSRQLLDRFDGQVPDTHAALQSLPGVGVYATRNR